MNPQPNTPKLFFKYGHRLPVLILVISIALIGCLVFSTAGGAYLLLNKFGERQTRVEDVDEKKGVAPVSEQPSDQLSDQAAEIEVERPDEAVLQDLRGLVEVSDGSSEWMIARHGEPLFAGAHIRTAALSSATVLFWDGSSLNIGPQAEVVIEELDARAGGDPRIIVLNQLSGESEHQVAASTNPDSKYEVRTSAATAAAKGTAFRVRVSQNGDALINVSEGTVAVSGQEKTVLVKSGQATSAGLEQPPADPVYFFTGQGPVTLTGETWIIAGQALTAHEGTVVIGNPQENDEVFFEGRLMTDGTRLVDLVVLLTRSPVNRFTMVGSVDAIGEVLWTINGQEVAVTEITEIGEGIEAGVLVQVDGIILPGGTLQAESICLLVDESRVPFDFTGIIQDMESDLWVISDIAIRLTDSTTRPEGLEVGDLVRVTGWVLEDGSWQASSIEPVIDESTAFEFVGVIESMEPWNVSGVVFETAAWTVIEEGLAVGDRVQVKGFIQEDGAWLATEIHRLEDWTKVHIILVGRVTGKEPWVVSGVALPVDAETIIKGEINLGDLVRVEIQVQPDGSWKVLTIEPLEGSGWGAECRELTSVVVSVSGNQVQLEDWPVLTLDDGIEGAGELRVGSIVVVQICYGEDGVPVIVYIHVILEPEVELPPSLEEEAEVGQEKVMVCHKPNSKNPHTIIIARPAVPAHLGHGDILGPCP